MCKIKRIEAFSLILLGVCCLPCVAAERADTKALRTALEKKIDCHLLEARQKIGKLKSQKTGSAEDALVEVRISCSDVGAVSNAVLRLGGTLIGVHARYRCVNARIPLKVNRALPLSLSALEQE